VISETAQRKLVTRCRKSENCRKIVLRSSVNLGPGYQTDTQAESFWPAILLAQPAELKDKYSLFRQHLKVGLAIILSVLCQEVIYSSIRNKNDIIHTGTLLQL